MPDAKAPIRAKAARKPSRAALLRAATCGKGNHDWRVKAKMGAQRIVTMRCSRCHTERRTPHA